MNISGFWQQPAIVRIVQIISLLVLIAMIVMMALQLTHTYPANDGKYVTKVIMYFVPLLLWATAAHGIFRLKKWGWALTCGIVTFSLLGSVNFLLSRYGSINPATVVSVVCSAGFIVLLHHRDVLQEFKTHLFKENEHPLELTPFAVVCMAGGLFLFMEFFSASRIGPGSLIPKLFITGLGCVFILLGTGLYRLNKTAMQSAQAILIFTFMSAIIIFTKDYFSKRQYFPLYKSLFYITIAAALLFFWRQILRHKLTIIDQNVEQ